ncbi:MAG: right-handed parallel beta-helix repeat-containing protein, partial [Candidatus Limnocylindrales bacterium]
MNHPRIYRRFAVAAIALLLAGILPGSVLAVGSTWYVSSGTHVSGGSCVDPDYNDIQLAVDNASTLSGDTVHVCAGTYNLSADISIAGKALTFVGAGAATTTINGASGVGIFWTGSAITVEDLTLQNGNPGIHGGGAILAGSGAVTVLRAVFNGNVAPSGGAIVAPNSIVSVSDSTFHANTATNDGGAIVAGTLTVTNSTFDANSAHDNGAIEANTLTVSNSTFVDNSATGIGAAVSSNAGSIVNSTFSGNSGADVITVGGAMTISNSILAAGGTAHNCGVVNPGSFTDGGGNLSTDTSCVFAGDGTAIGDLHLEAVAGNGGPTQTIALGAGSVAINHGVDGVCAASPVNNL